MKVMEYSISILSLIVGIVFLVEISDLDSFEWITENGEDKPVLKIIVNDKTIKLPLRLAPFCHLAVTKECECFILNKIEDSLNHRVASFVKCGDEVRGMFTEDSDYFELAPKKEGKPAEHIVKVYKPIDSLNDTFSKASGQKPNKNVTKIIGSSKYIKPIPEYGQLLGNETGYVTIKFVVPKSMLEIIEEPSIDFYLQNYVNLANQYMRQLNMLIVYKGWMKFSPQHPNLDIPVIYKFVYDDGCLFYDDQSDALVLIGPVEDNSNTLSEGQLCFGVPAHFVRFFKDRSSSNMLRKLQSLLYTLALRLGVLHIKPWICGMPPEGIAWIMNATLETEETARNIAWAYCSIVRFEEMRKNLACFRRMINTSRHSCGNGLVEDGEECDCVPMECKNCCSDDCKLTEYSTCSNGPCCDLLRCQFFDNSTQCRASEDFCDIPELCDGSSSQCPPNYVVVNGYECKGPSNDKGYCYNGVCGNRGDVCEWTFYNGSDAGDKCYELNTEGGTDSGGCGPTLQTLKTGHVKYSACDSANMLCGKIYCTQPGPVLYSNVRGSEKHPCGYMGLLGSYRILKEDPTFVPNGTSCGNRLTFVKQKCSSLPKGCPENCAGEKIEHPYTGEIFPAFELGTEVREEEPPSSPSNTAMFAIIFIGLVIIIIGVAYGISKKGKENGSSKCPGSSSDPGGISNTESSSTAPKKSSSKEATSEIGHPKESSFIASSEATPSLAFKSQSRTA